jgi:hypothetical protein
VSAPPIPIRRTFWLDESGGKPPHSLSTVAPRGRGARGSDGGLKTAARKASRLLLKLVGCQHNLFVARVLGSGLSLIQ